ncbi:TonB-dependent siderophore receptor [Cronbergia sp. UHCC 0137]|uniref:TonB-dependent siderophore receptor n=1 Tax=Cronbergia sp. UHCC 0137 TaxID=3110239 RepID=UPI002B1FF7EB|nr:TonB-dependent siderophore receptor [Cronbergia sp. UHCC 0137]MEA5617112.1 TonB-dependent siderophore receptor [Cronbergia sp. UHCC 0137]
MKLELINQISSAGLALAVIGSLIQPAYAEKPTQEISSVEDKQHYSTSAAQLLTQKVAQTGNTSPTKITGVKLNTTNKGIELILESPNIEAIRPVNKSQDNNFIVEIPNTVLSLGTQNFFNQTNPISGITNVSLTQIKPNTVQLTITGEKGVPTAELFDSDEGLIFEITPVAETPTTPQSENQTQPEQPTASQEPIELTVIATPEAGYLVPEATTGTKIEVPLRDVPASIQVIPKEVIRDRQVVRLNELADNVSGVRPQGTLGGLASQGYFIRGFSTEFEALRDGFKDFGFTSPRDVASVERVEFLKGPASVLYGSANNPGGVVNTITKKPLSDPFYQIGGTFGSYDFYRGTIDLTGPLTENRAALYRLNIAYENANSFRDFIENESTFINPVVSLKVGENTDLTFAYEYQKYNYTFDRGFPSNNTVIFDLPINRSLDEPNIQDSEYKSNNFTYVLESRFGDNNNWKFRQAFNVLSVTGASQGVQADAVNEDGQTVRRRFRRSESDQTNITFQNEISGKFNTGTIRHNVLVGLEFANNQFQSNFFRGNIADLNIFNPVYGAQPERIRRTYIGEYGGENVALYLQNLIELTPNVKFLTGGRFDWVNSYDLYEDAPEFNNRNSDSEFSPRLGIVYQPTDTTSIYASWTNAFNPQYFGRNRNNEQFKPETSEQFEIGIKQNFLDNRLSATLAFFDITKKNVLTTDPVDTDFSVQTGEQKSRGVELDIAGEITPGWKIIGTYAYIDAYVSENNDLVPIDDPSALLNDQLPGVPYHSASLWTTYEFQQGNLQGLGLGLGLVYGGEREASLPNQIQIPSFLRTDASVFYKRKNWRFALNFKNLFDTKYYESQRVFVVPAAPLTVIGNITFEF